MASKEEHTKSESLQSRVEEQIASVDHFVDRGLSAASDALRSSTAVAKEEIEKAAGLAKHWYLGTRHGLQLVDETLIGYLRAGVDYARQNETVATVSAIGIVALILPTTRRMLWRATFGRFRSEEAAQLAAEQRLTALTTTVDAQAGEVEKLSQRLSLAQEEYARGLAKLQSTAGELRNLIGRVEKTESKTRMFMGDLRELRAKHALQMRSEAAVQADKSGKQRRILEKLISTLTKDGF